MTDLHAQASPIGIPQLSKPITIPGKARHRTRGYNITTTRGRCSSCSSSNRHSVFSDTLDRDESSSFSANSPGGLDLVNKSMSSLKLQETSTKPKLSTSEGTKSSKTLMERRRSLPDLANPRKRSLLRRSLRFRKKKDELNPSKELTVSAPIPNTEGTAKFYIPGQDAMIPGVTAANSSLESKLQCNLYDLVPIRDHQPTSQAASENDSLTKRIEDLTIDTSDVELRYDTPPPPKAVHSNTQNLLDNGSTTVEDSQIYGTILEIFYSYFPIGLYSVNSSFKT